jgi:hypothetical protein
MFRKKKNPDGGKEESTSYILVDENVEEDFLWCNRSTL